MHEVFEDNSELKTPRRPRTAEKCTRDIDAVAAPDVSFFRGTVSRAIRASSKFLHPPATDSGRGST